MRSLPRIVFGCVVACLLTGMVAICASATMFPLDSRRVDVGAGRNEFSKRCASCHTVSSDQATYGPSLQNIGLAAASRVDGVAAERYIFDSIVDPSAFRAPGTSGEMPKGLAGQLSAEQLGNLVAFLCEQGGKARYRAIMALPARPQASKDELRVNLNLASVEHGKQLFFGKAQCSSCHWLDGSPGAMLRAPELLNAGVFSRDALRQAIVDPSKHVAPAYVESTVLYDGMTVSGYRLPSKPDRVKLLSTDNTGALLPVSIKVNELEPLNANGDVVRTSTMSPMPVYKFAENADELEALLDFLLTIR